MEGPGGKGGADRRKRGRPFVKNNNNNTGVLFYYPLVNRVAFDIYQIFNYLYFLIPLRKIAGKTLLASSCLSVGMLVTVE